MSRRRGQRGLVTIWWRDIPAQVTAGTAKALLDARFQHAIDRAAVVAGLTDTSSYVAEWRRVTGPVDGDPTDAATAEAERLDAAYPPDRLEALVRAGGVEATTVDRPDQPQGDLS